MGNAAAIAAAFGGVLPPGISGTNDRCTVLVSNLNPDVSLSRSHKLFLSLSLLSHTRTHISGLSLLSQDRIPHYKLCSLHPSLLYRE